MMESMSSDAPATTKPSKPLQMAGDPAELAAFMEKIPLAATMHYKVEALLPGEAVMRAPYERHHDGIFHSFHGGLLMTLADTVACAAILTLTGTEQVMTTTDMNIRFLAPCNSDVIARARVIKYGRSLVPVQVDLFDTAGKQVALAQVTYMRLEKMPTR